MGARGDGVATEAGSIRVMKNIPARVETLARAMCVAVDLDPDNVRDLIGAANPYPRIMRSDVSETAPAAQSEVSDWLGFAWRAHLWIFEHSGGELPAANETTTIQAA
jgi:hypothetical protein